MTKTILAIETSCDDTSVAIVRGRSILSNIVASQIKIHELYGGVVPELASRQHLEQINICLDESFAKSGLDWNSIDAIASTVAPGLVGSLLVGLSTAKTLAMVKNLPFLGVHHLEGHLYASYLAQPELNPPFLCLLVSGGHTSLIVVKGCGDYEVLGTTRDDAAGEAFDKVARLLGMGYPGGPLIDRSAQNGDPKAFKLPDGRVSLPQGGYHPYDMSFSGLKTSVLRLTEKLGEPLPKEDIAASFQYTVAKSLTRRAINCAIDQGLKTIVVGGGVAANSALREHLEISAQEHCLQVHFPPLSLCTDNAAMIGCAAAEHFDKGHVSSLSLGVSSRMPITDVMQLYLHDRFYQSP
jgi:N6-L-threonylcarbamoyladenine synthase